jgi:glutathione S-transferase
LEELGLPFTVEIIQNEVQQSDQAGGAPPVQDKNTGMIILNDPNNATSLWESLAIVEYLVQTYDKEERLRYAPNTQNWWMCQQWLAYQMGAQSPFFSLKAWFSNQHRDKVPSVVERFSDDVVRIASIMEHYLKTSRGGYLVGDKCTYADLVFVPWNNKIGKLTPHMMI